MHKEQNNVFEKWKVAAYTTVEWLWFFHYLWLVNCVYNLLGPFKKFAAEIEEQIEYCEIGTHLIAEGLLTKDQQQKLSSCSIIDAQKKRIILSIVLNYNLEDCKKFLKCLQKSVGVYSPHKQLYNKLLPAVGKYL